MSKAGKGQGSGRDLVKLRGVWLALVAGLLAGCGGEEEGEAAAGDVGFEEEALDAVEIDEPASLALEVLTGGHTKLVWSRYLGSGFDTFSNGAQHVLMGLDSRDGRGVRQILEERGNYSRPLVVPDGSSIVYTRKNVERGDGGMKDYEVTVRQVAWDGSGERDLAEGYATDVWTDGEGVVWVYVVRGFKPDTSAAMEGSQFVRFRLDDPEEEELLWDKTPISPDNIQLSRSGDRASFQFPWPHVGVLDLAKGERVDLLTGCWAGHSPDDSGVSWVFDGSHRTAQMFMDGGARRWDCPLNTAEAVGGHEVYHPRWSNHPRFVVVTGPYKGADPGESQISKGGKHAEVVVGRFAADLTEVESWVRVTEDEVPDLYPDLWVAGGELAELSGQLGPVGDGVGASELVVAEGWPASEEGLLFLFERRGGKRAIPAGEGRREVGLEGRGLARFWRAGQMRLDGGAMVADAAASAAVSAAVAGREVGLTLEMVVTPLGGGGGTLVSGAGLAVEAAEDGGLVVREAGAPSVVVGAGLEVGEAKHVVLVREDGRWSCYVGGEMVEGEGRVAKGVMEGALAFGEGWDGMLDHVAIYGRAFGRAEVEAHAQRVGIELEAREELEARRVRAKLVAASGMPTVEGIDPYTGALMLYRYEVAEGGEGEAEVLYVWHWGMLSKQAVPGFPREVGGVYELELGRSADHPELEGERMLDQLNWFGETYYDVGLGR